MPVSTNFYDSASANGIPLTPDEVASRGTPEWRKQFATRQDYISKEMARRGAFDPESGRKALMDLGMQPKKDFGLANFSRLDELTSDARNQQRQAEMRYNAGWGGGMNAQGQRVANRNQGGGVIGGGFGQGGQQGFGPAYYRNNPSGDPNVTMNDALSIMNANRGNALGVQGGVQDTWGAILGMKFNPQTGSYEKMDSGSQDAMLAPMIQGIMKNAEGLKQQVMNSIPPGGQRDKALAQISEQAQAQIAQGRQGMTQQALGALSNIYMQDKYWTDPLATTGLQLGTQRYISDNSLANQMAMAQMQDATQRYGIGQQTGLGWGQLGLGQDQLTWDMDRYQRDADFRNTSYLDQLNQNERNYNWNDWNAQNPAQFNSASYR